MPHLESSTTKSLYNNTMLFQSFTISGKNEKKNNKEERNEFMTKTESALIK